MKHNNLLNGVPRTSHADRDWTPSTTLREEIRLRQIHGRELVTSRDRQTESAHRFRSKSTGVDLAPGTSLPQSGEAERERDLSLKDYKSFIGQKRVDFLMRLAEPLANSSWANINSTYQGGGVAEMLRSVVPLMGSLGIRASWHVIHGHHAFFQVTKKFHNSLQGVDVPVSMEELFGTYLDTIQENAKHMKIGADMVVVHDPQPAALIMHNAIYGNVLWRCHIDTSVPNQVVWRFLLPYINQYSGAIFTMPEFVSPGLQIPTYQITPAIDPLAVKNWLWTDEEAHRILGPLFHEHDIDPQRPILAAVSRYDIHKNQGTILQAFKRLRQERNFRAAPYLIFLGNTATDDPEGEAMLRQLQEQAGDDPDVKFWVNVDNNDQVVGALMHLARGFVHVSTKEGFGLVVSEALWHGTPVIGSRVGGIARQVLDGKNGFVVDPLDVEAIAEKMAFFLDHPQVSAAMGHRGWEHVRQHFLLPELVFKYLTLLRYHTAVDFAPPPFRMNPMAYREILDGLRRTGP